MAFVSPSGRDRRLMYAREILRVAALYSNARPTTNPRAFRSAASMPASILRDAGGEIKISKHSVALTPSGVPTLSATAAHLVDRENRHVVSLRRAISEKGLYEDRPPIGGRKHSPLVIDMGNHRLTVPSTGGGPKSCIG